VTTTLDGSISLTSCFPLSDYSVHFALLQCFANGNATLITYVDSACQVMLSNFTGKQGVCLRSASGRYASAVVACGPASLVSPSSYYHRINTDGGNVVIDPVRSLLYFIDSLTWLRLLSSVTGQELRSLLSSWLDPPGPFSLMAHGLI
jgi:hypothetical protein